MSTLSASNSSNPPSGSIDPPFHLSVLAQDLWSDIFAGQIIASLIVVLFLAIFLLREWILQNARPDVFGDPLGENVVAGENPVAEEVDPLHVPAAVPEPEPELEDDAALPPIRVAANRARVRARAPRPVRAQRNRASSRNHQVGQESQDAEDGTPLVLPFPLGNGTPPLQDDADKGKGKQRETSTSPSLSDTDDITSIRRRRERYFAPESHHTPGSSTTVLTQSENGINTTFEGAEADRLYPFTFSVPVSSSAQHTPSTPLSISLPMAPASPSQSTSSLGSASSTAPFMSRFNLNSWDDPDPSSVGEQLNSTVGTPPQIGMLFLFLPLTLSHMK